MKPYERNPFIISTGRGIFLCLVVAMFLWTAAGCQKSREIKGDLAAVASGRAGGSVQESARSDAVSSGETSDVDGPEEVTLSGGAETAESMIVVDVCGAVVSPGVYTLFSGARVFEAVDAAGGFLPDADTAWQNRARVLADGEQIYIPTKQETADGTVAGRTAGAGSTAAQAAGGSGQMQKVNINTASSEELQTLPGIGSARAAAIIAYREEHGGFGSIEELMQVSGIKEATFERLQAYITN